MLFSIDQSFLFDFTSVVERASSSHDAAATQLFQARNYCIVVQRDSEEEQRLCGDVPSTAIAAVLDYCHKLIHRCIGLLHKSLTVRQAFLRKLFDSFTVFINIELCVDISVYRINIELGSKSLGIIRFKTYYPII
jgi:hypothetical protein